MTSFRAGVEAQPQNLEQGAQLLADALAAADLAPLREGTTIFSGIGASWHALTPAVRTLRAAGRRAFAVPAAELEHARGVGDAYVLVSQSGASSEVLAARETLEDASVYAVSAHGDSPLARGGVTWLPLGPIEDTPVSTLAYTSTLQALGLLCDAVLARAPHADWSALPTLVQKAIERHDAPAGAFGERLASVAAIDAVGGGAAAGSAGATALLAREGIGVATSAMETREYLHGPLEAVDERFGCVVFGSGRELELVGALASYGATVCSIGEVASDALGVQAFVTPPVIEAASPIVQIVPVQLAMLHAAAARGLTIETLRRQQSDTKVREL